MKNTENIAELINLSKNCLGSIDIEMKIKGMRKSQSFCVYPISKESKNITIQSETRIAQVNLNGEGLCSKPHASGAYFLHLQMDKLTPFKFAPNDWRQIVEYIGLTEGEGSNPVIKMDNTGVKSIFGLD
jgi:hypothetical protein